MNIEVDLVPLDPAIEEANIKEACPDCGKFYQVGSGMTWHRKAAHTPDAPRKRGRPKGSRNRPKLVTHLVRPRVDHITAEQISEAAAALIWPDGVPHQMLPLLLRWHTQTAEFLDQVQPDEIPET